MALLQGIAIGLRILVGLMVVLLVTACVLLLRGSTRRHMLALIAFVLSGALSLAWIIAVPLIDNMIVQQLADATSVVVALLVPDVICATVWPWLTLALAIIGGTMAARRLPPKTRAQDAS